MELDGDERRNKINKDILITVRIAVDSFRDMEDIFQMQNLKKEKCKIIQQVFIYSQKGRILKCQILCSYTNFFTNSSEDFF